MCIVIVQKVQDVFHATQGQTFVIGAHSHDIHRNFRSAYAVTLSLSDTLIVLFYFTFYPVLHIGVFLCGLHE